MSFNGKIILTRGLTLDRLEITYYVDLVFSEINPETLSILT